VDGGAKEKLKVVPGLALAGGVTRMKTEDNAGSCANNNSLHDVVVVLDKKLEVHQPAPGAVLCAAAAEQDKCDRRCNFRSAPGPLEKDVGTRDRDHRLEKIEQQLALLLERSVLAMPRGGLPAGAPGGPPVAGDNRRPPDPQCPIILGDDNTTPRPPDNGFSFLACRNLRRPRQEDDPNFCSPTQEDLEDTSRTAAGGKLNPSSTSAAQRVVAAPTDEEELRLQRAFLEMQSCPSTTALG